MHNGIEIRGRREKKRGKERGEREKRFHLTRENVLGNS